MYKSIDFVSFQKMFSTDKKCWNYLVQRRWPNGFICPECQCKKFSYITTRKLFQCTDCRHQWSVTAGTVFHKSRTSLKLLFWLLYFIAYNKNGQSALDLTRKLKISYKVAWTMTQKIRSAMIDRDAKYKLAGLIEFDDTYFGAKNVPGLRGRGADKKTPVLVIAQLDKNNNPQYASMIVVENIKKKTVENTAKKNIEKDSTIVSDGYKSFKVLGNEYNHIPKVIRDPKLASTILPWVHIFIANAKSMIRGTYKGVDAKYLQRYLSEFCYRLNRRFDVDCIFDRLITACLDKSPITLAELRA